MQLSSSAEWRNRGFLQNLAVNFGLVAVGFMWLRMVEVAQGREADDLSGFYRAKIDTARFYMQRIMPQTGALFAAIMAGSGAITDFEEEAF